MNIASIIGNKHIKNNKKKNQLLCNYVYNNNKNVLSKDTKEYLEETNRKQYNQ